MWFPQMRASPVRSGRKGGQGGKLLRGAFADDEETPRQKALSGAMNCAPTFHAAALWESAGLIRVG